MEIAVILFLIFLVVGLSIISYHDYIRMRDESKKRFETMDSICSSLASLDKNVECLLLEDSVNANRLNFTCHDCKLYEHCFADAFACGEVFDYLVCEKFIPPENDEFYKKTR